MYLTEAARAGGTSSSLPPLPRPMCMAIPATAAQGATMSLGCIGNRVPTDVPSSRWGRRPLAPCPLQGRERTRGIRQRNTQPATDGFAISRISAARGAVRRLLRNMRDGVERLRPGRHHPGRVAQPIGSSRRPFAPMGAVSLFRVGGSVFPLLPHTPHRSMTTPDSACSASLITFIFSAGKARARRRRTPNGPGRTRRVLQRQDRSGA